MRKYLIILTLILFNCKQNKATKINKEIPEQLDTLEVKDNKHLETKNVKKSFYVADVKGIKLRKAPDGEIIGSLPFGEKVFEVQELDSTLFTKEESNKWYKIRVYCFNDFNAFVLKSKLSTQKPTLKNKTLFDSIPIRGLPLNDTIPNFWGGGFTSELCKKLKLDDFFPDCYDLDIEYQIKHNDSITSLFCDYRVEGPLLNGEARRMIKIINMNVNGNIIDVLPIYLNDSRLNIYYHYKTIFSLKNDSLSIFNKKINSDTICNEKRYIIEPSGKFIEILDFEKISNLDIDEFNFFNLSENAIIKDEITGSFSLGSLDSISYNKYNLSSYYHDRGLIIIKHKAKLKNGITSIVIENVEEEKNHIEVRLFNYDENFNIIDDLILYINDDTNYNRYVYEIFDDIVYITETSKNLTDYEEYKIYKTEIYKINTIGQFVDHKILNKNKI